MVICLPFVCSLVLQCLMMVSAHIRVPFPTMHLEVSFVHPGTSTLKMCNILFVYIPVSKNEGKGYRARILSV